MINVKIFAFVYLILVIGCLVNTHPVQEDNNSIEKKIEEVNANVPVPVKQETANLNPTSRNGSQRKLGIFWVPSRVNGKFGKSIRAFTSDEFESYLDSLKF